MILLITNQFLISKKCCGTTALCTSFFLFLSSTLGHGWSISGLYSGRRILGLYTLNTNSHWNWLRLDTFIYYFLSNLHSKVVFMVLLPAQLTCFCLAFDAPDLLPETIMSVTETVDILKDFCLNLWLSNEAHTWIYLVTVIVKAWYLIGVWWFS